MLKPSGVESAKQSQRGSSPKGPGILAPHQVQLRRHRWRKEMTNSKKKKSGLRKVLYFQQNSHVEGGVGDVYICQAHWTMRALGVVQGSTERGISYPASFNGHPLLV